MTKKRFAKTIIILMKPTLYFIAQWLSGIKLRLNDLFNTYSTVRGWTDEAKLFFQYNRYAIYKTIHDIYE